MRLSHILVNSTWIITGIVIVPDNVRDPHLHLLGQCSWKCFCCSQCTAVAYFIPAKIRWAICYSQWRNASRITILIDGVAAAMVRLCPWAVSYPPLVFSPWTCIGDGFCKCSGLRLSWIMTFVPRITVIGNTGPVQRPWITIAGVACSGSRITAASVLGCAGRLAVGVHFHVPYFYIGYDVFTNEPVGYVHFIAENIICLWLVKVFIQHEVHIDIRPLDRQVHK